MPISSLIVKTKKNTAQGIVNQLENLNGVSVAHVQGDDIVLLTETFNSKEDKSIWDQIESTPNVLNIDLIYHNFEDVEEK